MKKKLIIILSVILAAIIAVGIGYHMTREKSNEESESDSYQEYAQVPEVKAYYGDTSIGTIYGYLEEMDRDSLRDVIVPVSSDRKAEFIVDNNDNEILSVSYLLTDPESGSLMDSGDISDLESLEDDASFTYVISAAVESSKEYELTFTISTDHHEEIYYYTRVMLMDDEFVEDQIAFAKKFSNMTFNESTSIANYLEVDSSLSNDNLGVVTLASSYSMVVWSTLEPEKTGKTTITAREYCIKDSGQAGTYTLNYQITATNAEKVTETYNVSETITVWTCSGQQYVLAYDREINQVWEASSDNIGNSFIDIGIQNYTSVDYVESEEQEYIGYEVNGDVYVMNLSSKTVSTPFKLSASSSEELNMTKARILSVDDDGNADFVVYGYEASESYPGENGIAVYHYDSSDNVTEEITFVSCEYTASILEEGIEKLCYVSDNTLYVMIEGDIYYANMTTMEWGTLASVDQGAMGVSANGKFVAFNTGGQPYDTESITVVDLDSNTKTVIKAPDGGSITVYGYTGENLIYGTGEDSDGKITDIVILDDELNEIKEYTTSKGYISNVEITDTIINIERKKYNGKDMDDDQLLDNTEKTSDAVTSSYYIDDVKMKELALSFTESLNSMLELTVNEDASVVGGTSGIIRAVISDDSDDAGSSDYLVFGYGVYQGRYTSKSSAVKAAKKCCGVVIQNGTKIWVFEENYS